ncbi:hypothetical protein [Clostridium estertheticum]|uniref:hypothetical protein n=1 Tax=Clostridium estertheticum TaxID=238834 RepID=UPI001C7D8F3E|nr:hypothetical protein [Clostridium estertheticum]MBX4263063.1 hypothetical protein [Clostridium estertheticum]MBX4271133.1 hypothetical protein [Clostridium estertheticum]WLC78367.1 hypothetical protein KTC98_14125 [Clostridium estertheticum]WLC89384.1 hypothetical protein KTC95_03920 [Clostridium estertheticum]
MIINCLNCNIEMKEAGINVGANPFLLQKGINGVKKMFSEGSRLRAFVCTKCGRVEFIAEKPEIFKDDVSVK